MTVKNVMIGIAQGLLSIAMLGSGLMKIMTPYEEIAAQMTWAQNVSSSIVFLIGLLEISGVIGMNLPYLLKKHKQLIPIASGGIALTMFGAVLTHAFIGENIIAALVLLVIASYVTYSRLNLLKENNKKFIK